MSLLKLKTLIPILAATLSIVIFIASLPYIKHTYFQKKPTLSVLRTISSPLPTPTPSPIATSAPSPSPTPVPTLSPVEREALYGPCAQVPTLMYHHVESEDLAKAGSFATLNVTPTYLRSQLTYLKDHKYTPITLAMLIDFFDHGTALPSKPVLITFDDAYADFVTNAAPILSELAVPSTLFVPTGLLENPGYATWQSLSGLNPALFLFGNHTWSHHSAAGDLKTETFEITTADTQLKDHHFNAPLVFAYPYGPSSKNDETVLTSLGYKLAFTTTRGTYLCKGQRFELPRIRVGNASLSSYGL